jgi:ribonuclease HI
MVTAYIDGGSRGNPGPAGYGVVFVDEQDAVIAEIAGALGRTTNNVAEYEGLLAGLRHAIDHGYRELRVRSDSLLLVQQMKGVYKVRHPGLEPPYQQAQRLASRLDRVVFEHVPRHLNARADTLANQAMDDATRQAVP